MKNNYENRSKTYLTRRVPVIIRLDGRCFHTFTKNFKKPYDEIFHDAMNATMKYLCENIQGCVLGYTQSDEITLILIDYKKLNSSAWFDYEVQKMCSISASMATMAFNRFFREEMDKDPTIPSVRYNWYVAAINKAFQTDVDTYVAIADVIRNCELINEKVMVKAEIQIRTLAMDLWASLEHKLKYKKDIGDSEEISRELKECSEAIAALDLKMQSLRDRIEEYAE